MSCAPRVPRSRQRWLEARVVDGRICTVPPFTGFQPTVAAAIKQCKSRVGWRKNPVNHSETRAKPQRKPGDRYCAIAVLLRGPPAVPWPAIPGEDQPNYNLNPACSATALCWAIAPRAHQPSAAEPPGTQAPAVPIGLSDRFNSQDSRRTPTSRNSPCPVKLPRQPNLA
jgi:hypothetical protein